MSQQQPPGPPPPGQPPYGGPPPGPPPYGGPPPGHPPPGRPPYGPPPGQFGPPPGRPTGGTSKGVIVAIVVGVLVVVGGGVAAAILLLGGDDEASTESPLDTAEAFAAAWRDGDCDTLEGLVTDRFLEAAPADCRADEISGDPGDPEITEESDDKATAVMEVDGSTTWELQLVNEGGSWLIDGIGAGSSSTIEPDVEASPASSDAQAP